MVKYSFNELENQLIMKSLQAQRQGLQSQLDSLDALIAKCTGDVSQENNVIGLPKRVRPQTDNQITEKMLEVLNNSNTYLTTRQILEAIKAKYQDLKDMDKPSERRYVANLSARLTKGFSDGEIDKDKIEGKDAKYGIKKGQLSVAQL